MVRTKATKSKSCKEANDLRFVLSKVSNLRRHNLSTFCNRSTTVRSTTTTTTDILTNFGCTGIHPTGGGYHSCYLLFDRATAANARMKRCCAK